MTEFSYPLTDEQVAVMVQRYGYPTTGPNWQAEDYKDGAAKDRLLNQAKEDCRSLLADRDALLAKLRSIERLAEAAERPFPDGVPDREGEYVASMIRAALVNSQQANP